MSRMLTTRCSHAAATAMKLALCAGLAATLAAAPAGCKARQKRVNDSKSGEPVNTGLSRLGEDRGLALPEDDQLMEQGDDKAAIREQIEESARQLSVYFANLEIDGPAPVNRPSRNAPDNPAADPIADPGQEAADRINDQIQQASSGDTNTPANPDQPNPRTASTNTDDDGGVRVSLMGGARDAATELPQESPAEPTDEPTATPDPEPEATETEPAPEPPVDPEQRRDQLARELATILSQLAANGDAPGSAALALASLETILPSDTATLVDEGVLSDAELASLSAARTMLRSMGSGGEIASPAEVSDRLEQIKSELDGWAGMTIRTAALCTSVQGYGRYETFPSYRFLAGRPQEVIVYTELERFAQRQTTGPDGHTRYAVELSQRLELYHVADDLNTWNRAAETVTDESRNRLRDYYLTNQVRLPANLGVGRYHLKIVMRDLIGDKAAETIIPIEIVAR